MDEIVGMKVLFYFLFAVISAQSNTKQLFIPAGPDDGRPSDLQVTVQKKTWQIGQLGTKSRSQLRNHLAKYGYVSTYTDSAEALSEGIMDLQYFANIPETGLVDEATVRVINTDRCGRGDPRVSQKRRDAKRNATKEKSGRSGRFRRYNHQGTTWKKQKLTWQYIHNRYQRNRRKMSEDQIRTTMTKAMKVWTDKTNIEFIEDRKPFTPGPDEPDVLVKFVSDRVGGHARIDPWGFDGKGGTLAHAFYPLNNKGTSGDVHFDDDEDYTVGVPRGGGYETDLNWVATHELGHTLGLDHSRNQDAIMYPYYKGYITDIKLSYDDIKGIQTLYGGKVHKKAPKKRCPSSYITAVWDTKTKDGTKNYLVVTEDQTIYQVSKDGKGLTGGAIPKSRYYRMSAAIDAAYQTNFGSRSGRLYDVVFANQGYYIYQGFSLVSGPHNYKRGDLNSFCRKRIPGDRTPLKLNFPSSIRKIDAVVKWHRNKKIYFFTGDKYYKYDERTKKLACGYPRLIARNWRGIPAYIDAAYSSADGTFFIKNDKIYRLDDRRVRVKAGYPKNSQTDLFGCKDGYQAEP